MSTNEISSPNADTSHDSGTSISASSRLPVTPPNPELHRALQDLQNGTNDSNDSMDEPASKKIKYIKLSYEQFEQLMQTYTSQQDSIARLMASPASVHLPSHNHSSTRPAYYTNATFEEIACRAIKPAYDGSEDQLVPFLTRLDIRRQNEGWSSATFVTISDKIYDLTSNFASISEPDITAQAEARWNSPTINDDKHTIDHPTYNSRLLAIVIINSITTEFLPTLLNRIPHLLRNDGTYLLWSLSHNIHRNNVSFTEHISEKIRLATLSQFNNDVTNYIIFIKDNL
jgi:hypothetical protein